MKSVSLTPKAFQSLYSVPEYENTRGSFRRTVANAEACNISWVTPWIWLGGGGRRLIDATHDASIHYGKCSRSLCVFLRSLKDAAAQMRSGIMTSPTAG